jgi:AraC-like DNA-binding protein
MIWNHYDDFDAWGEAVQTADLRLVCDAVERRSWRLKAGGIGDVFLQMADEGGGNLCHGANTHTGIQLFVPLSHAVGHICNCEPLDAGSLLVIPPGADFSIHVRRRAHSWLAMALPARLNEVWPTPLDGSRVLRPGDHAVGRLVALADRMLGGDAATLPRGAAQDAAVAELVEAAGQCLVELTPKAPAPGRPRIDRGEIIRRSMAALETEAVDRPSVGQLAVAAGVTERTLARAFRDTFGTSPMQYVLLRQLHAVRRGLRAAPDDATVSAILVRHGIWDHGRFAARYRRHFGESPSATLTQMS